MASRSLSHRTACSLADITDPTSGGASSMYFDFDAFDEVAVNTGGNDLKVQTGGLGIKVVTRRGTNQFKGNAKFGLDNDNLESSNLPDELVGDERLGGADKANHTDAIRDRSVSMEMRTIGAREKRRAAGGASRPHAVAAAPSASSTSATARVTRGIVPDR